jgi:hypothetical protein
VVGDSPAELDLLTKRDHPDHAATVAQRIEAAPEGFFTDAIEDGGHATGCEAPHGCHPVSVVVDRFSCT